MRQVVASYEDSPYALRNSIRELRDEQPEPMASAFFHPDQDEAVTQHTSRFSQ